MVSESETNSLVMFLRAVAASVPGSCRQKAGRNDVDRVRRLAAKMEGKSRRDVGDYFPHIGEKREGRSASRGLRFANLDEAHRNISERAASNPFLRGDADPPTSEGIQLQDLPSASERARSESANVMDTPSASLPSSLGSRTVPPGHGGVRNLTRKAEKMPAINAEPQDQLLGGGRPPTPHPEFDLLDAARMYGVRRAGAAALAETHGSSSFMLFENGAWVNVANTGGSQPHVPRPSVGEVSHGGDAARHPLP